MNTLIFRENAADMDQKQVLVYLLQFTKTTVNKEALADSLMESFGSLKNVLEAQPEALENVPGIGRKSAELIASFLPIVRIWQRINMQKPERIGSSTEAGNYCKSLLSGLRNEEFWVICLNAQCNVVGKRRISQGSLSECSAYPRKIMETALNYNAHSVLLCHNHPGGTLAPSMEDIKSTEQIKSMMKTVGIMVLDHVIVARDGAYSMVQHGDIDYR